jgi:histidyl-tRNA synthetase
VIATAISALVSLGLGPDAIRVKLSHRHAVAAALGELGVSPEKMTAAFELLDRRDKLEAEEFTRRATELGLEKDTLEGFDRLARTSLPITTDMASIAKAAGIGQAVLGPMEAYRDALVNAGIGEFCDWDLGIVRGLAYYTGGVFEIHDADGKERAIAGGGRYDGLVELLGGPPTSAVGLGMGDLVLSLVLQKRGLLENIAPATPDVFLLSIGDELVDAQMTATMQRLRSTGIHARRSYRATKNVGKLLSEAAKSGARAAVIFGEECLQGSVAVKDLGSGEQETVVFNDLDAYLGRLLSEPTS